MVRQWTQRKRVGDTDRDVQRWAISQCQPVTYVFPALPPSYAEDQTAYDADGDALLLFSVAARDFANNEVLLGVQLASWRRLCVRFLSFT